MNWPLRIILAIVVLIIAGGILLLTTVDLQPPTQHIEKTIPLDRFGR